MKIAPILDQRWRPLSIQSRHALLINPFYRKDAHASFGKHVLTPTLALTSIAASTPDNWTVEYWDENLLQGEPPRDPFPQVVGITVHLTFAHRAFELASWFRERGAKVILGGLHVQSCPAECEPYADALAFGDGVQLWGKILKDLEQGNLSSTYSSSFNRPYGEDPPPRRDLVPKSSFLTSTSLIATRGCHSRCDFCYLATDGLHMPYRMRSPEQIVDEFQRDKEPYAVFTDNNLGSRPEYLRELCHALKPLEKIWSAAVSLDVTEDPTVVRDMALAGCTGVFVGFESLQAENIVDSGKISPSPADYARRVRIFHDHGIQVNGSFVFGFDHDQVDVFQKTADWVEENRLECATFHILTPYPATPLFRQLESQDRILHKDWKRYDTAHVVFKPKNMSAAQLLEGYEWCYDRLFSHSSIWRRRPSDYRAVAPYLAMSYLYKRSNFLWHLLIKYNMTHALWRPLVELTRRRHVRFRRQLGKRVAASKSVRAPSVVSPGV